MKAYLKTALIVVAVMAIVKQLPATVPGVSLIK